jgi:DNA-binding winged helix-turn-helix (wHTH) protein
VQFVFGEYTLDPDRRELTRAIEPVALGPQVFDLLLYLVRHRGRVVSKEELLDAVWGGRIVSESTVTSHINAMRKAIGDSGSKQRFVRTVARKWFHFAADVQELEPPAKLSTAAQVLSSTDGPLARISHRK